MIVCPNCQHENIDGTMFCEDCGSQVVTMDSQITQIISEDESRAAEVIEEIDTSDLPPEKPNVDTWASLHLIESGQILPLADRSEFTLGRVTDDQAIMPDIDLTPYKAYAQGVSRLHTVIIREGKQAHLMDLGSANGTYLNGKRLKPNVRQALKHGDLISLGKLKIQILLKDLVDK
jgi:hypothetical protein